MRSKLIDRGVAFALGAIAVGALWRVSADAPPTASDDGLRPVAGAVSSDPAPAPAASEPPASDPSTMFDVAVGATLAIRAGNLYGAGVIVDGRGAAITAAHVVGSHATVHVRLSGGATVEAEVVAVDEALDLALLRLDGADAAPPPIGRAMALRPGDGLFAVGNPKELGFSVHRGAVSYTGRRMRGVRFVQADIAANPGSSGGPVFDDRGRLIGVMSFVLRDSAGIAFVTPVEYALQRFAGELDTAPPHDPSFRAWADDGAP